ncbi:hypothetical protein Glove_74g205 [Diversispora epigaea]|uniref:BTB domain-containing protein n=1 Tax=Diversispora epigaea TaxID=1348612 RepID=A0A397JDF2_9GLOM|nr:hypothetical protein Glove_74g205 [Diversispora epigaea]
MTTQFYERLSNDLTRLLENSIDYNVTIEVGENKQIYKLHSYILQSRSSYFYKKLNEISFNENHIKVLKMPDISIKIFDIIIKYIYGGIISLENFQNSVLFELLIASNELNLDKLIELLQTHFVVNNASWLKLNFSWVCRIKNLKNLNSLLEFCNNIIAKHPDTIFGSDIFLTLPEDTLISIIKKDDLQLEESKIWQYLIQWGKAQNPTLPTNLDEWTSDDFLTLKTTLKNCLPHIRYFSISSEDVFKMILPYQQILESEVNNKQTSPTLPRKINKIIPTRSTLNIITDKHALKISSWIDRRSTKYTKNNPYEFKLLVRGSRDGFDVGTIYKNCDKISSIVIVLKVKDTGEILGGYIPCELDKDKNKWIYSPDSFIFSLKTANIKKSILSRVSKSHHTDHAIANFPQHSTIFFGNNLCLVGNLKNGKKCCCLQNKDIYDSYDKFEKPIRSEKFLDKILSENSVFNVEEYEIFQVSKKK